MKLLWKKTANPEPQTEIVAPPAPAPAPEPAPVVADDQDGEQTPPAAAAAGEPGGIDFTRVIASIVTAASAVFTVWSVWDLTLRGAEEGQAAPHVVGLGAGVGVEAVWLWLLAIEWQQASRTGRVHPALTRTGWVLAFGAAVVLVVHGVMTSWPMALLAVLPLAAKAGWHWLTALRCEQTRARLEAEATAAREAAEAQRKAEEEAHRKEAAKEARASKLSAELTEEQQAELAALEREAAYVTAKTEKELALDAARAHAEQQRALADIRRQAERQMAVDEGAADIEVQRAELRNRIRLASPVYTVTELPAGGQNEQVPNDPSGFGIPPVGGAPVAGFGFAQAPRPAGGAPRPDLRVPPGAPSATSPGAPGGAPQSEEALSGPQRLLAYVADAGEQATVKGAAREMGVHPRTIRRYRERLAEAGHDVSALGTDPADS